jgi:hypothetical protein
MLVEAGQLNILRGNVKNYLQNTWQGQNNFTHTGNQFWGIFNGVFYGNGSNLTGIPSLTGSNTWTGINTFQNASNVFFGNGANLTALNPANISSGTFGNVIILGNASGTILGSSINPIGFVGSFTGNGSGLTGIPTLAGSQTWTGVNAFSNTSNTFSGVFTGVGTGAFIGDGSALTGLSGSEFSNVGAHTVFGNFTGSSAGPTFASSPTFNGSNITALDADNITTGTVDNARLQYRAGIAIVTAGNSSVTVTLSSALAANTIDYVALAQPFFVAPFPWECQVLDTTHIFIDLGSTVGTNIPVYWMVLLAQ